MANILNPTIVSIVKGTSTPIVRSLSYGGSTLESINSAFQQANTALSVAQNAYNYANTISGGSAIDNVARVIASTAANLAQDALNQANSNISLTISAYRQANIATTTIAKVDEFAHAAFNKANVPNSAAAGSTYQVQYNRSGILGANSHFIYDYNQNTLHVDKIDAVIDAGTF
jgi:hypothetical protein